MAYLDKVPEDKVFVLGTKKLFSLEDLLTELKSISDDAYSHYASENHNYFADWVMHVIKYDKLAADLINTNGNRGKAVKVLEKHIKKLKKKSKPSQPKKIVKKTVKKVSKENPEEDSIVKEALKKPKKPAQSKVEEVSVKSVKKEPKKTIEENEFNHPGHEHSIHEIEEILEKLSKEDTEIRNIIWKHFKWELPKEFMYGMGIGILMGIILSKLFMP